MSKIPGLKRNYVLTVTTDIFRGWTEDFTFRSGVNGSFYILYIYLVYTTQVNSTFRALIG